MAEDTTDYTQDDDVLIKREREFEAQRREAAAVMANPEPPEPSNETLNLALYQHDTTLRQAAVNAVVQSGKFESFEELMANSKELYSFLSGEEAAGAPEAGDDGLTLPA